ncbi:unnamed protein product (macronuclear) [Paramecium tetraurelia]|uniref:Transmembrane protein n=1 Tax=Paramecium tetraurelia TaxID=5888 RepID=A0DVX1_PARTE|nr:uncharacterized protein GSPATT00020841001 [Paramecium tetraurelia]CAK87188.1 unnamed protein product [Paramecium tetraurelia]|eukprot:XP_001454585.1 hypothetical protein (macronuclear) [Paramecium tetraurelia strain d4-2]
MNISAVRSIFSFLSLNALLQIYENQPVEFWDSNQMMSHPKLTPIFQSNQYINLLAGLATVVLLDKKQKLLMINSIVAGSSIVIQDLNLLLPKTWNMITIYFSLIALIAQLFQLLTIYYDNIPSTTSIIKQDIFKEQKQIKKQRKMVSSKKKEQPQLKKQKSKQIYQIEGIEQLQNDKSEIESIENDFNEFMKPQSNDQTLTEVETENLYEINHADLSQISQTKEDPKLTFQFKFKGEVSTLHCTFDTFDSSMSILNSVYTQEQIKQIKTHLLLNLYDENEDCSCRLWCLKKLLILN